MVENESTYTHFDVNIEPENVEEKFHLILTHIRPLWDKKNVIFKTLPKGVSNGLLNTMIKCHSETDDMDVIMIRIHNNDIKWIDRSTEVKCIEQLQALDCAPKILATFATGFCYQYYHGEILTPFRLKEDPIWRLIAVEFAKFHSTDLKDGSKDEAVAKMKEQLDSFISGYPQELQDPEKNEMFKRDIPPLEELKVMVDEVQKHCDKFTSPLVLCHNDNRAENIIWNPEEQRIHFVDFEAMNYGYQANELAAHFARYCGFQPPDYNLMPSEAFQMDFLRHYLEKYYTFSGKNSEVTEKDVRTLYVQVCKYHLLQLVLSGIAIPVLEAMNIFKDVVSFNLLEFAVISINEYYKQKDRIMAMTLPD